MKSLNTIDIVQCMSSLEIAELTGKRHDHVKRDIDVMMNQLGDIPKIGDLKNSNNQTVKVYLLNEELSITLVSGYNIKMRHAIIKRWRDLESNKPVMTRLELAQEQVRLIIELDDTKEKVKSLEIELDESLEWSTIKRMESITGDKYDWRELKISSIKLGIKRKDVFDANYGSVKSYHKDLWMDAFNINIECKGEKI